MQSVSHACAIRFRYGEDLGSCTLTWIKVDLGSMSLVSSKLHIKSVRMKYDMILKKLK